MDVDWKASIVRISSSSPEIDGYGTGFVICQEEQSAYVVTCGHVVSKVGGSEVVMADDQQAKVEVSGSEDGVAGIDLAVLRVEGLLAKTPLLLSTTGARGNRFIMPGYYSQKVKGKAEIVFRPLHGVLGEKIATGESSSTLVDAWDLTITDDHQVVPGYSGSPIIDEANHKVLGVASRQQGGKQGMAISIEALSKIWPNKPSSFTMQEADLELLTPEERQKLIDLLSRLPGIEYANVRHSLVSTLPAEFQGNTAFDKPPELHITETIDMVLSKAPLPLLNGHYPITVIIQNAINREERPQPKLELQLLLDTLMKRLGVIPRMVATSLRDSLIYYLDNFINQLPALHYELQRVSGIFNDHIIKSRCVTESTHLAEVCTPISDCNVFIKSFLDPKIVFQRFGLMNAIEDFEGQAKAVQDRIEPFCIDYGTALERDQYIERSKIQRQLASLALSCSSVLAEAKTFFCELRGQQLIPPS